MSHVRKRREEKKTIKQMAKGNKDSCVRKESWGKEEESKSRQPTVVKQA